LCLSKTHLPWRAHDRAVRAVHPRTSVHQQRQASHSLAVPRVLQVAGRGPEPTPDELKSLVIRIGETRTLACELQQPYSGVERLPALARRRQIEVRGGLQTLPHPETQKGTTSPSDV